MPIVFIFIVLEKDNRSRIVVFSVLWLDKDIRMTGRRKELQNP